MRVFRVHRNAARASAAAFTLMEVLVVVAIIGFIMAAGIPTLYNALQKEGMRKAINEVMQCCENARRRAILSQSKTAVVFYPLDRKFKVEGGGGDTTPGSVTEGRLPDDVFLEGLGINWIDFTEARECRAYFYPNSTSDELIVVLRSSKNEYAKISLELATGLVMPVETDVHRFLR